MQTKILVSLLAAIFFGHVGSADTPVVQRKLDTIIVPKVSFEDASVSAVFHYLKQRSKDLDPKREGVSFLLNVDQPVVAQGAATDTSSKQAQKPQGTNRTARTAPGERTISMDFDNIPLSELIRYVCQAAGLQYRVEKHAVIIADRNVALDKMETRIYPIGPGFLDSKRTR